LIIKVITFKNYLPQNHFAMSKATQKVNVINIQKLDTLYKNITTKVDED